MKTSLTHGHICPLCSLYPGSSTAADLIGLATWPALALFTKYTLDMDQVEHHDRAHRVEKKYPHMVQTRGVNYGWGSPCTALDFECERAYKIKMDAEKANK